MTLAPGSVTERDIDTLRGHGFDDTAITIAVQVIGYFNYINRVADGLGVDDEEWFDIPRDEWFEKKGTDYGG